MKSSPKDKEKKEIERRLKDCNMEGFITGMDRSVEWTDSLVAHIYRGTFNTGGGEEMGGRKLQRNK